MLNNTYVLYNDWVKYYIIPNASNLPAKLPYPNSYLSFYFKHNAETICKAMNAAFNEGYRFHTCFGGK